MRGDFSPDRKNLSGSSIKGGGFRSILNLRIKETGGEPETTAETTTIS